MVEYGVSLQTLTSGQAPPPEGARVDVHFEGPITGAKISGSVKGVDHLNFRADGGMELHIHGEITTEDGLAPRASRSASRPSFSCGRT